MPRPSLKKTRSTEILDAFMRCVARYGLDGSTLERIAEESGIGRPLIRHYLGNREQMVIQLLDHVTQKFEKMTADLFDTLPAENRLNALMEALFSNRQHASDNAAVFQALVAASERYTDIKAPLLKFVTDFEARIAGELLRESPQIGVESSKIAACGVTAIYFNTDAIMPLNPSKSWQGYQRLAAQQLLDGARAGNHQKR